jgi:hypothetical protein
MLQVNYETTRVKFTGPSLARTIPNLSPVERAFVAVDLHRGELIKPTITQVAMLVAVSPTYVHCAARRMDERKIIEQGLRSLIPTKRLLPAPAPVVADADQALLAANVGPDRWLSAAAQAGI